jgi:hypothetical protein
MLIFLGNNRSNKLLVVIFCVTIPIVDRDTNKKHIFLHVFKLFTNGIYVKNGNRKSKADCCKQIE